MSLVAVPFSCPHATLLRSMTLDEQAAAHVAWETYCYFR
jgi:hypothetical protein